MSNPKKAFLFVRDYSEQGDDLLYIWDGSNIEKTSAEKIINEDAELICHDYWLIAPAIYQATKKLPRSITDIEELRISTSGRRTDRELKEKIDISNSLSKFADSTIVKNYLAIFNRKTLVDEEVLSAIGAALIALSEKIEIEAKQQNEWERFVQIERPVTEQLIISTSEGIGINTDQLRLHKKNIDFEYYMALKNFSSKYNMPLEVPTDEAIIKFLEPKGYDFTGVNVDYVLKFVPMQDNFAFDAINLLKISKSRKVLNLIPLSQKRIFPITDIFGSITSRIYYKDPPLQNLAKQHRDILYPDEGKLLSYVDFDQFEAGIMGALSDDTELLELYKIGDLYEAASEEIFKDKTFRKQAKRLFLSYAYGMKKPSLYDAAANYGADRQLAKDFFNRFSDFEKWKTSIHSEYSANGVIGTSMGNHMRRDRTGALSEQEKRSAVSQVVQGTASLIFKKALLRLREDSRFEIKVPMHDAVLFQHDAKFDPAIVASNFASAMTEHFRGKITGKASLGNFFQTEKF
ncbi:DNA polymerase [Pseudomonas gozinkensis]|uniref:DNA polymerase n=1 Tax=Pseudomonas gozinkensis TaxID=2774461 RepID=UPI0017888AC5|nr:DNA polymerase [Pseudomonas gozinkensis]